ncbi:hypothetical protein AGMMS50293_03710 [Spirochaetia bacterium]|nr:hypothetical protein AGMMS50293_03710 [Spirochaetia bacterium]
MSDASPLHSRYNPQAEAERYIDALNLESGIGFFILIEPGLGYLIPALRRRFQNSKITVLHADSRFRETESPGVPAWYPDSVETAQGFLEREIPDAAGVRIIEWRPSLRFYGDRYVKLLADAADFIKRVEAGRRTVSVFGRRWVKNFFRNVRLMRRALLYRPMEIPVIITGSGPGLEDAVPKILAMQGSAFVIAASSSLLTLSRAGVRADMVISTDGGSWALTHLYSCFRRANASVDEHACVDEHVSVDEHACVHYLAIALSAALPSQCGALPFLALNDGSLWQSLILNALNIPSLVIPQRGTVSASALDVALALSSGSIYLAGMDLAVRDIRTHTRPYGFDHLFLGTASRLRPFYSQCFTRSNDMRLGGSHAIYAAWFKNQLALWPRRIFSLGGNAVFETSRSFAENPPKKQGQSTGAGHFKEITLDGTPEERCEKGADALINALDDDRFGELLKGELAPLLFPEVKEVAANDIRMAIEKIAGPCRGKTRG